MQIEGGRAAILDHLAAASGLYYRNKQHWPMSLSDLETFASQVGERDALSEEYKDEVAKIPFSDLEGKVTFQPAANGSLNITVSALQSEIPPPLTTTVSVTSQ